MTDKKSFFALTGIFEKLFGKKDESAFDAQRERLRKVQSQTVKRSEEPRTEESNDGKLRDAIRIAGTNGPARKKDPLKDKKTREEEISKMTGLSVPQQFKGPGVTHNSLDGSDNFKHWLGGSGQ